jgi:hypothetical protein
VQALRRVAEETGVTLLTATLDSGNARSLHLDRVTTATSQVLLHAGQQLTYRGFSKMLWTC